MLSSRSKIISRLSDARPCVVSDSRRYVVDGRGVLVGLSCDDSAHVSAVAASGDVRFAQVGVIERDFAVVAVECSSVIVDREGGIVEEGIVGIKSGVADADEDIATMWCKGSERGCIGLW